MEKILTLEIILFITLTILIFILIGLLQYLLRKFYVMQKIEQYNSTIQAENLSISDTDEEYIPQRTKIFIVDETIESPNHFSAYVILNNQRKTLLDSDEFFIGYSKNNNLVINDRGISPKHCKIKFVENTFYLFDLMSHTGTFLNGKKLLRPREINDWDEIRIGNAVLTFRKFNITR